MTVVKKRRSKLWWLVGAVIAYLVIAAALNASKPAATASPGTAAAPSGPTSTRSDAWGRDQAVAAFEGLGFKGSESPLNDGTPRWLGRGSNSSTAEVIGAAGAVKAVSVTTIVNGDGGKLTGTVLGTFLPGSSQWVTDQITGNNGVDIDKSKDFAGGSAHVQTLNATDGTIVIITITRA